MSRRVRTLLVTGVLFVVLFVLAMTMPVPYVVLSPGPTRDTLGLDDNGAPVVSFSPPLQGTSSVPRGHLNLTTVSVSTDRVTAVEAVVGWLKGDEVVVPRAAVIPPGVSQSQVDQQNAADFSQSQDSAIIAATCELYPSAFGIVGVVSSGPSNGKLEAGDALVSLSGKPVPNQSALLGALTATAPGTPVSVVVVRAGQHQTFSITLGPSPKDRGGGTLGITVGTVCPAPFQVKLGFGGSIGGPSAGLMFALGIVDKVLYARSSGSDNLTGGRYVAGTGEISPDGKVGPIGGIALKMQAARHAGATIFLAPTGNCSDVRGNVPSGLQVVRVDSLHAAIDDLKALRASGSDASGVPSC